MYDCCKVRPVWSKLQALMRKVKIECDINIRNIVFNEVNQNPNHVTNVITLITKQFIFRCKCTEETFSFSNIVREIKKYYNIELYNAKINDRTRKVINRWSPVFKIFNLKT